MLQQRPYTFAQTNLSPSFFACDKAADHTFWFSKQMAGNGKASTNKKVGNQIPRGRARSEGQGWRSIGGTNKFVPFPVLF